MKNRLSVVALGLLLLGALLSTAQSCTNTGTGTSYNPPITPADFVAGVNNQYFPLVPGTVLKYNRTASEGTSSVEAAVMTDTKTILGVKCVVVHDTVRAANGDLTEDTYDWYAQDKAGNVWYFGEATKSLKGGAVVSTKGSWEAGVNNAKPGIVMEANPKVNDSYRQEFLAGVAEDRADVLSLTEQATTPYRTFNNCLMTKDYSKLEPGTVEHKYFAPGVGEVLMLMVQGGTEREELVSVTKSDRA